MEAGREQPEGLRQSGSNTTSPTFRHPPSRRRRDQSAASSAPRVSAFNGFPLALPNGFPLGLGRGLHPNRAARALSRGFPLASKLPSRSREGYRSRTAAATDSSRRLHPNCAGSTSHSASGCIPPVPPPASSRPATPTQTRKSNFAKRTEPRPTAGAPQSSLRGKILQVRNHAPNAPAGHPRP
jgi:hypothetical protein